MATLVGLFEGSKLKTFSKLGSIPTQFDVVGAPQMFEINVVVRQKEAQST